MMMELHRRFTMWRYRRWERRVVVLYYRDDLAAPVKPPSPLVARFVASPDIR
jgi:hypothetical protein